MRVALIMLALLTIPLSVRAEETGYMQRIVAKATSWWEMVKAKVAYVMEAKPAQDQVARTTTAPLRANDKASKQPAEKAPEKSEPQKSADNKTPVVASTGLTMGETSRSAYALKPDLGAASARVVVTPVQFQPVLTLRHSEPRIAVSSIPSFTFRIKKSLTLAPALPLAAQLKTRVKFAGKLDAEPVNAEKLHFKRTTNVLAFDATPLQKINALPPDTFILIRGLFAWLLDRRDEAMGVLHGLGLKSENALTREKSLAFVGWILEDAGQKGLASLAHWRALSHSSGQGENGFNNAIVMSLSQLSHETGLAKSAPSENLLERTARGTGLKVEALAFVKLLQAERAYDHKNFAMARKLAKEVPDKNVWKDHARYLAAMAAFGAKDDTASATVAGRELTELFRTVDTPDVFDATAVSLGRIHFILGNYTAASKYLSQVSRDTNIFIEAAVDNAWSLLRAGDRNHAVGNMFTLHTPYFDGAYMPESYFLQSLGYQEICQFGDALTSVKQYKVRYVDAYKKLIEFNGAGKTQADAYYDEVVAYLGHHDIKLAPIVLRELGRHPEFLRRQKELNRISREEQALATAFPANAVSLKDWFNTEVTSIRAVAKSDIGNFMKARAVSMEDELKFLTANVSLLEYEIFAGAGTNLSLQGAQNFATDDKAVPKRKFEDGKEYWPYEDEIWEDELNNFRSKMVDGCAKVKKAT